MREAQETIRLLILREAAKFGENPTRDQLREAGRNCEADGLFYLARNGRLCLTEEGRAAAVSL